MRAESRRLIRSILPSLISFRLGHHYEFSNLISYARNTGTSSKHHHLENYGVYCISCFGSSNSDMSRKQTPSDFLKQIIGRPVVVKLNNGVDYRGKRALFLVECTLIVSWCVTFRTTTFKLIINLLWYFMIYCIYRRYPIHLSHVLLRALGSLFWI